MSNTFKTNSRFSALIEGSENPNKEKEQKNNKQQKNDVEEREFSCFRPLDEDEKERRRLKREAQFNCQKKIEEQEKNKPLIMDTNNFPDLLLDSKEDNIIDKPESYLEKLKHKDISINVVDPDLVHLKKGWVLLKRNHLTGKSIIKKHPTKDIIEVEEDVEVEEEKKNEWQLELLDSLIKLHEKRRQEYIDNYGYEEWERMFKFPNWREEEAYLEMMEQELTESDVSCDEISDDDNGYDY
jgi:hypothetical protein